MSEQKLTAVAAYAANREAIDEMLVKISTMLVQHAHHHVNEPARWDLVGDLGYTREQLEEVVSFLESS